MKNSIWLLALIGVACSKQPESIEYGPGRTPANAELFSYQNIPDLQRAVVRTDGDIILEGDVSNGYLHGSHIALDGEGRILSLTTYRYGKKHGLTLIFDDLGYVETKASFYNDQLDGEMMVYKRRKKLERKTYANGVLHGLQQKYYPDGTTMEESNYTNGQIDGVARWYDLQGNLTIEYEYDNGKLIEE